MDRIGHGQTYKNPNELVFQQQIGRVDIEPKDSVILDNKVILICTKNLLKNKMEILFGQTTLINPLLTNKLDFDLFVERSIFDNTFELPESVF